MDNIKNFVARHSGWLLPGVASIILLAPNLAEIRSLLLASAFECLALAFSGLGAYVYTRINFTKARSYNALGYIFLGVHICIGLVVIGVYIAQIN